MPSLGGAWVFRKTLPWSGGGLIHPHRPTHASRSASATPDRWSAAKVVSGHLNRATRRNLLKSTTTGKILISRSRPPPPVRPSHTTQKKLRIIPARTRSAHNGFIPHSSRPTEPHNHLPLWIRLAWRGDRFRCRLHASPGELQKPSLQYIRRFWPERRPPLKLDFNGVKLDRQPVHRPRQRPFWSLPTGSEDGSSEVTFPRKRL